MDNSRGEELTILLKDGRTVVESCRSGASSFAIGDQVKILSGSSSSIYGGPSTQVVRDDGPAKSY